jgi:hypothetical protein
MVTRLTTGLVIVALGLGALSHPALAQAPPPPPGAPPAATDAGQPDEVTPARVSYTAGSVSFWRPGGDDWSPARTNIPLAPGDQLYAAGPATVEVQVGPQAFVRATDSAHLGLDNQDEGGVQLRLTSGQASVDVRALEPGHTIELATPHAAFTVDRPGYYRIEVAAEASRFAVHRGGPAAVAGAGGSAVTTGQEAIARGPEEAAVEVVAARPLADWDHWNETRTTQLVAAASARYVPSAVYGAEALDQHGSWSVVEPYGPVWTPAGVPGGWVPYSAGRWIWDPRFGWTWLDDAPWGWAPYHYGRWVRIKRGWAWAPGPVVVRAVYAPALVVFLRPGVLRVGRPLYWAPLGWGEPVVPWWGRPGFIGVPTWAGWGGPRDVRHVVHRTTVHVSVYKHVSVTKAVVGVPAERFGRGATRPSRLETVDVQRLSRVAGGPDVRPAAASVTPATGPAVKPPAATASRTVVATRPPHDPAPALRRAGLPAAAGVAPPTRVVKARTVDRPSAAPGPGVSAPERPGPQPPAARDAASPPSQAGTPVSPGRREEAKPPAADASQAPPDPRRDARRPAPPTSGDDESSARPPSSPGASPTSAPRPGAVAAPHPAPVPPAARGAVGEASRDAGRDSRDVGGPAASPPSDVERAAPRRPSARDDVGRGAPPAVTTPTPPRGGLPSAAPPAAGPPARSSRPAPRPTAPGEAATSPPATPPAASRPSPAPVAPSPRPATPGGTASPPSVAPPSARRPAPVAPPPRSATPGDTATPRSAAPPSAGRPTTTPGPRPTTPAAVAPAPGPARAASAPAGRRTRAGDAGGPAIEAPAPAQRQPAARPMAPSPAQRAPAQRGGVERAPRPDAPPRVRPDAPPRVRIDAPPRAERRPPGTPAAAERPASSPRAASPESRRAD